MESSEIPVSAIAIFLCLCCYILLVLQILFVSEIVSFPFNRVVEKHHRLLCHMMYLFCPLSSFTNVLCLVALLWRHRSSPVFCGPTLNENYQRKNNPKNTRKRKCGSPEFVSFIVTAVPSLCLPNFLACGATLVS